jgi:hypothetical protein
MTAGDWQGWRVRFDLADIEGTRSSRIPHLLDVDLSDPHAAVAGALELVADLVFSVRSARNKNPVSGVIGVQKWPLQQESSFSSPNEARL